MTPKHPALALESALNALATVCGSMARTLRGIDDARAKRDRMASQLTALAADNANRRAKEIAERGGGLAEMMAAAGDAMDAITRPTPIVLEPHEEYLRADEAACCDAVERALLAVREGGAEPLDAARLPGLNASKRPSVELTERLGRVHARGLVDLLGAMPGLVLFSRDGNPTPGPGDNFEADAVYFRAVHDELLAVLRARPIAPAASRDSGPDAAGAECGRTEGPARTPAEWAFLEAAYKAPEALLGADLAIRAGYDSYKTACRKLCERGDLVKPSPRGGYAITEQGRRAFVEYSGRSRPQNP